MGPGFKKSLAFCLQYARSDLHRAISESLHLSIRNGQFIESERQYILDGGSKIDA